MNVIRPLLLFVFSLPVLAQTFYSTTKLDSLKRDLELVFADKLFQQSNYGFCAKSMRTGQSLYARNESSLLSTASCMKLVTTAAALDRWGNNHTFKTGFYTNGKISGGTIEGNLYLKGYGDPYFVSEILYKAAYHLRASGIKTIKGNIIFDDSYLEDTPNAETNSRAYSAIGSALGYNFNTVAVFIKPGEKSGDSANVFTDPVSSLFKVVNYATTIDSGGGNTVDNNAVSIRYGKDGIMTIAVSGTIASDIDEAVVYKRIEDPAQFTATIIRETFELFGIKVTGSLFKAITPKNLKTIFELPSYDLSYIVSGINKWSNNYAAGQLLMIMGAEEFGLPGTDEKGIKVIRTFLEKAGISEKEIVMVDGSGLDGKNKMTPQALVRVLEYMYHDFRTGSEFVSSLSIGGVDGTERKRFKKNGGPAKISRLKVGYLHGVSTLSGYIETAGHDVAAFAIMTNDFPKDYYESIKQLEDKICTVLSKF